MPPFTPSAAARRPSVVLLHSSAASARQWDLLAERLRPAFDVHAIDLHGHGHRAPWQGPQPLRLHDDAALALAILQRAGGGHLIGHSYGGAVALHLAAAQPALVHSLAVYEPMAFGLLAEHDGRGAAALEAIDLAAQVSAFASAGEPAAAAQRFVDYWAGAAVWRHWSPERRAAVVARMPSVLAHFGALNEAALPRERLARLTMPLLVMTGGASTAVARRIGELLCRLLPGQQHHTLPGLTHMAPITHPDAVNERLLCFHGLPVAAPLPA